MSKCLTCDYALYDGMCLAQGKFTVLDADSCELYRPTQGYEVARLKRENAKLRGICAEVAGILFNLDVDRCGLCQRDSINHPCPVHTVKGGECLVKSELREFGISPFEKEDE